MAKEAIVPTGDVAVELMEQSLDTGDALLEARDEALDLIDQIINVHLFTKVGKGLFNRLDMLVVCHLILP